ncbi:MAG: phosphate-starvation-inducible PsiE family protein [Acidimicrobiales bacterium]
MNDNRGDRKGAPLTADTLVKWAILLIEYAIVTSLLIVASVVLVRTVGDFFSYGRGSFSVAVISAVDGILVVIIVLDIAHTVFGHLRSSIFPVRPFLVIGVLAGVRDILSASARLTLSGHLTESDFHNTLLSLSIGVGVVLFLLVGLLILRYSGHQDGEMKDSESLGP